MARPPETIKIMPASPEITRYTLPGFGLPLHFVPREAHEVYGDWEENITYKYRACGEGGELFVTALSDRNIDDGQVSQPLLTLRELTMLSLMNRITDKPGWEVKVFDDTIAEKWKKEALATEGIDIVQSMVDWCIDELRDRATAFKKTGAVIVYNGDVVKSDTAVPDNLKHELAAAAAPLEAVPDAQKDWHPGSDGKVLDLVHPSLFPLVYGRSKILPDSLLSLHECLRRSGEGVVVPVPPENERFADRGHRNLNDFFGGGPRTAVYSSRFQWLPCDVELDCETGHAKIVSYINNLHPTRHSKLYTAIERLIDCAIPLWNITLDYQKSGRETRIKYTRCEYDSNPYDWDDEDTRFPQQRPNESEEDLVDRRLQWFDDYTRIATQPEPGKFADSDLNDELVDHEKIDLVEEYKHRGLQIIVKLANIHLTPEKPEYGGGTWHVEGQMNEHICATALYYYDTENITESLLSFRQQSDPYSAREVDYEQNHDEWLTQVFGCKNWGPAVQEVGDVVTKEGRLITFPNLLQHRVKPFKLADPTRPGHRKIVALFLVDPHIRVISTANIPPQQHHWWVEEAANEEPLLRLPPELRNEIARHASDFPIGMEEAKELRLELMEERKNFVQHHGAAFEKHTFSLCEH